VSNLIKLPDRACGVVRELPILFLDPHLLAVNKPAGIAVSLDPEQPEPSALLPLLHQAITDQKPWALKMELDYLMAVHRPDAQTSGVLLLARSREVREALAEALGSGKAPQQHLALVKGRPPEQEFELNAKLAPHPERPGQMRSDSKYGKSYRTRCEVRERFRDHTLLQCLPFPGHPGQITAHLRHARWPLVADPDRGGAGILLSQLKRDYVPKKGQPERPLLGRPALHLETVRLLHPVTGADLEITAPPPKDFTVTLKYLRQFAA
jgi:23S rRNA-/tRNA-specific pseudouridylate synthase